MTLNHNFGYFSGVGGIAGNVLQLTEGGIDNRSKLALSFLPLLVRCCYKLGGLISRNFK